MTFDEKTPEDIIEYLRSHPEEENACKSELIKTHFPFIVHTISQVTGKYVEIENSEELSIGLLAFDEAITKYNPDRGAAFLSFARLVITSRIKDYFNKERNASKTVSLEQLTEEQGEIVKHPDTDSNNDVALEIELWESIISKFGFNLEELAEDAPKHSDTRNNAIDLSEKISDDQEIVNHMYDKYKIPNAKVILRFRTTKKTLKRSRKFIIATVVILTKKLSLLKNWIYQDRKRCSSC